MTKRLAGKHLSRRPGAASPEGSSYNAFISYSHAVDREVVAALHSALESFATPRSRGRALRIFRDEANLSANPDLWGDIQRALSRSEFYLYVGTTKAAQSSWVGLEFDFWLQHRSPDKIRIILLDGTIDWDRNQSDFDWSHTDALPAIARGRFATEPKWVDLRWVRRQPPFNRRDPRFQDAVASLAAPLHGKEKDELFGEHLQLQRAARRQRTAFNRARSEARLRSQIATSRQLAAQALLYLNRRLDLACLLSAAAVERHPTFEARSALLQAVQARSWLTAFLDCPDGAPDHVAFSPDGSCLAVTTNAGLEVWDVASRARRATIPKGDAAFLRGVAFSPNGRVVAAGYSYGGGKGGYVGLWDLISRQCRQPTLEVPGSGPEVVRFSSDGEFLAAGFEIGIAKAGGVVLWSMGDRGTAPRVLDVSEAGVDDIAFIPGGRILAAAISTTSREKPPGAIVLWDLRTAQRLGEDLPVGGFARSLSASPDGRLLAAGFEVKLCDEGGVVLWDLSTRERQGQPLELKQGAVFSVQISPDGKTLAAAYRGTSAAPSGVALWNLEQGRWPRAVPDMRVFEGDVNQIAFSPNSEKLAATVRSPGAILLCDPNGGRMRPKLLTTPDGMVRVVVVSPNESTVATAFDSRGAGLSAVVFFDLSTQQRSGATLEVPEGSISSLAYHPSGTYLAAGFVSKGPAGGVVVWDLADESRRRVLVTDHGVRAVAFRPNGKVLAAGLAAGEWNSAHGSVLRWDFPSLRPIAPALPIPQGHVARVDYSRDGRSLAVTHTGNGGVVLINSSSGARQSLPLPEAHRRINSAHYDPKARRLALGLVVSGLSNKGQVDLFDFKSGSASGFYIPVDEAAVSSIDISSDSVMLAAGWEVPGGAAREFGGITGPDAAAVLLLDPASGQRLGSQLEIAPGVRRVTCLRFTTAGKLLLAGYETYGEQGGVASFDVDLDSWQRIALSVANRSFSADEWRQFFPNEPYSRVFADLSDST